MADSVVNTGAVVRDSDIGRRETFLRLISEYQGALRRLAAVYVTESRDREDLVQEIAVALWQAILGMPILPAGYCKIFVTFTPGSQGIH